MPPAFLGKSAYEIWLDSALDGDRTNNNKGFSINGVAPKNRLPGDLRGVQSEIPDIQKLGTRIVILDGLFQINDGEPNLDPHAGSSDDLKATMRALEDANILVLVRARGADEDFPNFIKKMGFCGWIGTSQNSQNQLGQVHLFNPPTNETDQQITILDQLSNTLTKIGVENLAKMDESGSDPWGANKVVKILARLSQADFEETTSLTGSRLFSRAKQSVTLAEQVLATVFFGPSTPDLLYGDEWGLTNSDKYQALDQLPDDPSRENQTIQTLVTSLISLRANRRSISDGDFSVVYENDQDGTLVISRTYRFETSLLCLNLSSQERQFTVSSARLTNSGFTDLIGGASFGATITGISVILPPEGFALLGTPASEVPGN